MTPLAAPARSGAASKVAPQSARPAPAGTASANELVLSALALRLAAGDVAAAGLVVDWPSLLRVARRERLAALAWLRVGSAIRERADASTTARWRALWVDAARRGEALLAACDAASASLSSHGIDVVILKGAPLAAALYGDPFVRCSDDADCYVAPADREGAARALVAAGWRSVLGQPPDDETFVRGVGEGDARLEVHSSLLPERLNHLALGEPVGEARAVGGRTLQAHAGPLVPSYLAAHLATHFAPPLLWWLDLRECWRALGERERSAALDAARAAGLGRYLAWGLRGAATVDRVLAGDATALARLGVRAGGRRDVHQLWRHLVLAPTVAASLSALRGWIRPSWAETRDGGPIVGTARRVVRHWRALLPSAPRNAAGVAPAAAAQLRQMPAALSANALLDAARTVTAAGGELPLTLTGDSMAPTLRGGDRLLLAALPRRPRRGDIVLVALGPDRPAIHRIERVAAASGGERVQTRGDNCALADPAMPCSAIAALVVASERDGVWTAHVLTLRFGVTAVVRGLALGLRARAAHVRRHVLLRRTSGTATRTSGAGR